MHLTMRLMSLSEYVQAGPKQLELQIHPFRKLKIPLLFAFFKLQRRSG